MTVLSLHLPPASRKLFRGSNIFLIVPDTQAASLDTMNSKPSLLMRVTCVEGWDIVTEEDGEGRGHEAAEKLRRVVESD